MRLGVAGGACSMSGDGQMRAGPARVIHVRVLAVALAWSVVLALPLIRARMAAGAARARVAAVNASLSAAQTLAGAMEAYDIERNVLPFAVDVPARAAALAPYLSWPVRAGAERHPFLYTHTRLAYRLQFTPTGGGVPVLLQITLGVGGVALASSTRIEIGW